MDEQLSRIQSQSSHDDSCCYFGDHKTLRLRSVSTYDLTGKSWICIMDLLEAPAREFEAIRQRMKAMPPHMVVAQHDGDSLSVQPASKPWWLHRV